MEDTNVTMVKRFLDEMEDLDWNFSSPVKCSCEYTLKVKHKFCPQCGVKSPDKRNHGKIYGTILEKWSEVIELRRKHGDNVPGARFLLGLFLDLEMDIEPEVQVTCPGCRWTIHNCFHRYCFWCGTRLPDETFIDRSDFSNEKNWDILFPSALNDIKEALDVVLKEE